jgi:putative FmdB family regulatory protein
MPIYEYECKACSKISAVLRSIGERDLPLACPSCGGVTSFVLSSFSTPHSGKSEVARKSRSASSTRGPTGVHIEPSGGATFKDCHFENLGTGISAPAGASVDIDGCTFSNVERPVEIRKG